MTTCDRCGAAADQRDKFCGVCGEFLSWDTGPAAVPPPAATTQSPSNPPQAPYSVPPQPGPSSTPSVPPQAGPPSTAMPPPSAPPPHTPQPPVPPQPASPLSPPQAGTGPQYGAATGPHPGAPPANPSADRYAAPPISPPGAAPHGTPPSSSPHGPQTAPPPPPAPVGLACAACGTDNDVERNFCRHCGAALRTAAGTPEKASWRERRRRRKARPAGYRHEPRRKPRAKRYLLIPIIALVALVVVTAIPRMPVTGPWVERLRDRISDSAPVSPAAVTASSESSSAERAFDGLSNDYWAPEGDGVGEWIEAEFGDPVRLVYLLISPGVSRNQEEFLSQARPKEIELELFTVDGERVTKTFTVADSAEPQSFRLGVGDVTAARLTVLSTYGFESGRVVAIAELEYFIRR